MRVRHTEAGAADVGALLARGIRDDNCQEIRRVCSCDPVRALMDTVENADVKVASYVGDDLVALWGVRKKSILSSEAYVWLIASNALDAHWLTFAKESKRILARLQDSYPHLENFVDAGNDRIIGWLKWLGFHFDPEPIVSPLGHQLYRFWR